MKKALFLSDFDGTITHEDFFTRYAEGALSDLNRRCLDLISQSRISSFEYLDIILKNIGEPEEVVKMHIDDLVIDKEFIELYPQLKEQGIDFKIVSAGSTLYIERVLERLGFDDIPLHANGGYFTESGIGLKPVDEPKLYCSYYGIDKRAVFDLYRNCYETVIYAGDGTSDFGPAAVADICFAKGSLAKCLNRENIPYFHFDNYGDIRKKLSNLKIILDS